MPLTYVVAGRGDQDSHLQALAQELGVDLRLLGYRNDVVDLYDAADAYILPSLREGLNVSLMEAMASGKPCLCGKIRGNVDLIEEGAGGFLFDSKDESSIARAINSMTSASSADRLSMGQYNKAKIQQFDRSLVDEKMQEIYQALN